MPGEPWEIGQRDEFRSRFGEGVDAYDRTRPVPPGDVFDGGGDRAGHWGVSRRPFTVELSAEDDAANLSTQSGVKQLPARARAELVSRVERRLEAQGGTLVVHHLAVVTVATRITAAAERAADRW